MQNYLRDGKIHVQEAKNLFRFRVRVAFFKENLENKYLHNLWCSLCHLYPDTKSHSVKGKEVKETVKIEGN